MDRRVIIRNDALAHYGVKGMKWKLKHKRVYTDSHTSRSAKVNRKKADSLVQVMDSVGGINKKKTGLAERRKHYANMGAYKAKRRKSLKTTSEVNEKNQNGSKIPNFEKPKRSNKTFRQRLIDAYKARRAQKIAKKKGWR